jgi:hypothetical protein
VPQSLRLLLGRRRYINLKGFDQTPAKLLQAEGDIFVGDS